MKIIIQQAITAHKEGRLKQVEQIFAKDFEILGY